MAKKKTEKAPEKKTKKAESPGEREARRVESAIRAHAGGRLGDWREMRCPAPGCSGRVRYSIATGSERLEARCSEAGCLDINAPKDPEA